MKLVILYGPPGVGKLTIANALAKKTGYKVFHNHLTHDLVSSLFDRGAKPFGPLIRKYRFELIEAAAQYRLPGVIFTYVYASPVDNKEMAEFGRRVQKHGGRAYYVQLRCSEKELERRIKQPSRKPFGKIKHITSLRSLMGKFDLTKTAPFPNTLVIDNTGLAPARVASIIQKRWKL